MCRTGLRHCSPRSQAHRERYNVQRRLARNSAKKAQAEAVGDQGRVALYVGLLERDVAALADLDRNIRECGTASQAFEPQELTLAERDALDDYGGIEHYDLNEALRDHQGDLTALDDERREMVALLDSALEKAPRAERPRQVFRGIETLRDDGRGGEIGESGRGWVDREAKVGSVLTMHGYTSTSTDADLAAGRFSGIQREYGRDGVVFAIITDRGMETGGGDEAEVLLPRGQRFRVDLVETQTFGGQERQVVHMTHLTDERT